MGNYEYYGLFLTQESKDRLNNWFRQSDYGLNDDIIKKVLINGILTMLPCYILQWHKSILNLKED